MNIDQRPYVESDGNCSTRLYSHVNSVTFVCIRISVYTKKYTYRKLVTKLVIYYSSGSDLVLFDPLGRHKHIPSEVCLMSYCLNSGWLHYTSTLGKEMT